MTTSHTTCTSDRPESSTHMDRPSTVTPGALRVREDLFDAIRLSRRIDGASLDQAAGIVSFPTSIIVGTQVVDIATSLNPGVIAAGVHTVSGRVVVNGVVVSCEFTVSVGDEEPAPASWTAQRDQRVGDQAILDEVVPQLPRSIQVRALSGAALRGAIRRTHLAGEQSRRRLVESNRGLVRTVVNRYRSVVRAEATSLELEDLMLVGEHQMLDTADRFFTDPALRPVRDVAWSKLVQRAVGNAVRSEIARATGISVEFRQLLSWFHSHPEDRSLQVEVVAQRMAMSAGTTRLMALRSITNRQTAESLLNDMLLTGDAMYIEPARDAAARAKDLRADGIFVISSRSSLAEIERARSFQGAHALTLDDTVGEDHETRGERIGRTDQRFDETDATDALKRAIAETGMSSIEALVWLHRSGALDPTGQGVELPEIADDLGLDGRSEARAALRRARRKLDTWLLTDTAAELRTVAS